MSKVVLLVRNVAPEKYGGGESYQLELAEQLRQHCFLPIIATSSLKLIKEAKKRKIKTIVMPYYERQNWSGWRNLLFPIYYVWQLRLNLIYKKIFKQYKPDVINLQSRDDWIAGTKVARKYGIKVLWTDHIDFRTWVLTNVNVSYKNIIGKWVLKWARYADKIIMISDFERKWFDKQVAPRRFDNVVTIKNGVRDEYARYKNIKIEKDSFCYVGRLVDYKGIKELIQAFETVHKEKSTAKLNVFGDGDLKKYETMAGEGVKFYGYTDEPLMAMAKNEVFVLPSYYEGLSIALLEAAMMGKKIIATKVDGNPEVVIDGKTGALIPAKNVTKLEEAMLYMLDNDDLARKMAKKARDFYKEEYDFKNIFEKKMLELYDGTLISIVVPVYNIEKYIEKCLLSLVGQTYSKIEIIVVDDGSNDKSGEICDKIAKKDGRLRIFHKKNGGLSDARNFGIKKARGNYIAFVDGDDYVEENYIKKMFEKMQEKDADIVVCDYNEVKLKKKEMSGEEAAIRLLVAQENIDIVAWNKLYRKDLFTNNDIWYPINQKHEDALTTYKILAAAKKVVYIEDNLYNYVKREGSIMSQADEYERLKQREVAANEAIVYFCKKRKLQEAAKVSLLTAKFAFVDAGLALRIPRENIKDNTEWIIRHGRDYDENSCLTRRLKIYLKLIKIGHGNGYFVFRRIV